VRFTETAIEGAFVVDLEPYADARGFFARAFCVEEFAAHGLASAMVQTNLSFNRQRGTIRGLHYQAEPMPERKLFRCISGASFHVLIDLRPGSASYGAHLGIELTAAGRQALYIPELCAAGYQALSDEAEVLYMVSQFYSPTHERGIRYDDPAFGIAWPLPPVGVSSKDEAWPLFEVSAGAQA